MSEETDLNSIYTAEATDEDKCPMEGSCTCGGIVYYLAGETDDFPFHVDIDEHNGTVRMVGVPKTNGYYGKSKL